MITLVEQSYSERLGGEWWLPGAGSERREGRCVMGTVRADDKVPEMHDGDGRAAVWMHFMPLN